MQAGQLLALRFGGIGSRPWGGALIRDRKEWMKDEYGIIMD